MHPQPLTSAEIIISVHHLKLLRNLDAILDKHNKLNAHLVRKELEKVTLQTFTDAVNGPIDHSLAKLNALKNTRWLRRVKLDNHRKRYGLSICLVSWFARPRQ